MHEFDRGVTKYDIMPIPPVEAQSVRFPVGPIEIWVEYRLLDEAIAAAHTVTEGYEGDTSPDSADAFIWAATELTQDRGPQIFFGK